LKLYDEKTSKDLKNAEEIFEKILDDEKNVDYFLKIKIYAKKKIKRQNEL